MLGRKAYRLYETNQYGFWTCFTISQEYSVLKLAAVWFNLKGHFSFYTAA